jgi:hypothetical protein
MRQTERADCAGERGASLEQQAAVDSSCKCARESIELLTVHRFVLRPFGADRLQAQTETRPRGRRKHPM